MQFAAAARDFQTIKGAESVTIGMNTLLMGGRPKHCSFL